MKVGTLPLGVALAVTPLLLTRPAAAPGFSPWSEPIHLDAPINSTFGETAPSLSKDGLALYFSSGRPCGDGDTVVDLNVWVAHRATLDAAWGPPECLAINVNGSEDSAAAFSRDGHWMFFVSDRPGSAGLPPPVAGNGRDIWVSWRAHVHDDHAWNEPVNAGADINSALADAGPSYLENDAMEWPQLFFTSNRNGTFDIWVSDVFGNGQFGPPKRVDELSTNNLVEARPSIRHDGLEIFFFSGLAPNFDINVATRPVPGAMWSAPVNLGAPINTAANDQQASIASDRETLFFASDRPGTLGGLDIWMSTRSKERKP